MKRHQLKQIATFLFTASFLSLLCGSTTAAEKEFTSTHKQARFIKPMHEGKPIVLNTFCLDKDGNLLACVGGDNVEYVMNDDGSQEAKTIAAAKLLPEERKEVVEVVTSWERKGIEKGIAQGIEKGMEKGLEKGIQKGRELGRKEGALETLRAVLLDLLSTRFGNAAVDEAVGALLDSGSAGAHPARQALRSAYHSETCASVV